MVRDGYNWRLNPLKEFRRANHEPSPRGSGNVVSIEFNLLYRWHATLSKADTKWTEAAFKKLFNGDVDVTEEEFHVGIRNAIRVPEDPRKWTFSGLTRDETTNRFSDADLAKILQDSTKERAAAYGAKGIPGVMKIIEVLGIEQGRSWGTCSLNEFRKFIGLKRACLRGISFTSSLIISQRTKPSPNGITTPKSPRQRLCFTRISTISNYMWECRLSSRRSPALVLGSALATLSLAPFSLMRSRLPRVTPT